MFFTTNCDTTTGSKHCSPFDQPFFLLFISFHFIFLFSFFFSLSPTFLTHFLSPYSQTHYSHYQPISPIHSSSLCNTIIHYFHPLLSTTKPPIFHPLLYYYHSWLPICFSFGFSKIGKTLMLIFNTVLNIIGFCFIALSWA